ncbi:sulfate/thiosulfate transporter subunit [Enterobacter cancerogenus]|uniref:Sulfate/thiosulfate transporter subunit n=1 Tax=Enterobacter cancerogenus TaxID=69218 RepID=A0A484ZAG1_9ENTR|nr:sulfate/thiosulfate transporter subunit [Enterobacter cancerogenus]
MVAAYKVTLLSAFVASIFNGVFGLLMAWILTRYRFPGRTLLDALMDLPFALPTAVAGLTLASLFSVNGFYGEWLAKFDIKVTYTWLWYRSGDGLHQHPRSWCVPFSRCWKS